MLEWKRVFMRYCAISLSKIGFYLGKCFLEVNEWLMNWSGAQVQAMEKG